VSGKYSIQTDFKRLPTFTFRFNRIEVGVLNAFLIAGRKLSVLRCAAMTTTHNVPRADGDRIEVIQFSPPQRAQALPALVYYHGGAFALTYASSHVRFVQRYATEANCSVFLVDYRLAPGRPFPSGFDDCYVALSWISANADVLGVDPARIAVMGDSAGGALAAGVAQRALDEQGPSLCGQLLVYPVIDRRCSTASARDFVDTPVWNAISNRNMWRMYLSACAESDVPAYASPADRQKLKALPRAYVETAEFDPLRDEGIEYATRLASNDVETTLHQTSGTVHGYDGLASRNSITQQSFQKRLDFLHEVFGNEKCS